MGEMNASLLDMAEKLENNVPVARLVDRLLKSMEAKDTHVVRTACLQWCSMLLQEHRREMQQGNTLQRLYPVIFETIMHCDDDTVVAALRVLAQIMEGRNLEEDTAPPDADGGGDLFSVLAIRLLHIFKS